MPLARLSRPHMRKIFDKQCEATIYNLRTKLTSKCEIDGLKRDLFMINLEMITEIRVFADDDWLEGDIGYVMYPEYPDRKSSDREIKFIETREEGVPIKRMTVIGTVDL